MKRMMLEPYGETPGNYPSREMKELFDVIQLIESPKILAEFFRDLLTMPELKEFAKRWQIVKLLTKGKPYLEIAETVGVSTTTVTRVAYWLHNGTGGYKWAAKHILGPNPDRHSRPRILRGRALGLKDPTSL